MLNFLFLCCQPNSLTLANGLVEKRLETLDKALEEANKSRARIHEDRVKVLDQFREKMASYEQLMQRNGALKDFLEKWRDNL